MDKEEKVETVDQNDRIMAALAHVTALLPMMGVIAPIVIWATQKDKSEFVGFQALQAVVYQITMIVFYFLSMALYMCSFFGLFATMPFFDTSSPGVPPVMFGAFLPFAIMGVMLIGFLIFVVYGVVATVSILSGKDFRYIVIGKRLENYLAK